MPMVTVTTEPLSLLVTLAQAPALLREGEARVPLAPRDAALLAWLALEGPTPRTRLAVLLWPQSTPESAGNALRQRLFQLRRQLGVELVSGHATLALAAGSRTTSATRGRCSARRATSSAPSWPPGWASSASAGRCATRPSSKAAPTRPSSAGDYDDALAHARELLALEPLSEAAHRRVIRLLYLQGDRAAALLAFDRCEQMLKDEVGATPSAETLALLATISAAGVARAAGAGPGPAGERAAAAAPGRPRRRPGARCTRPGTPAATPSSAARAAWARAGWSATSPGPAAAPSSSARVPATSGSSTPPRRGCCAPCPPASCAASTCRCGAPSPGCCPSSASRRRCPAAKAGRASSTPSARRSRPRRWRSTASSSTTCTSPTPPASSCCSTRSARRRGAGSSPRAPPRCRSPGRALLDEVFAPARAERVALEPLTLGDIAEIVDSLGIEALQGSAIAATLLRHCGGNPLYLLETLKAWIGGRGARAATAPLPARLPLAGTPARGDRAAHRPPVGRRGAAGALRRDRRAPTSRSSSPRTCSACAPSISPTRAPSSKQAQVLRDGAFVHDLIYESALASVPAPVARQLHAEVAAFLQQRQGEPARLAQHWVQAGEWGAGGRGLPGGGRAFAPDRVARRAERACSPRRRAASSAPACRPSASRPCCAGPARSRPTTSARRRAPRSRRSSRRRAATSSACSRSTPGSS